MINTADGTTSVVAGWDRQPNPKMPSSQNLEAVAVNSLEMVLSHNRGTPIWIPKYYNPYYGDPQKGTPNVGKPSDRSAAKAHHYNPNITPIYYITLYNPIGIMEKKMETTIVY